MHNLEINWEIGEVKMIRCLSLCGKNLVVEKDIEWRKKLGKKIRNVEKANRNKWE